MKTNITGLHHVTGLTADAQRNIDFYAGVLGLRMVKQTINYERPEEYHLYYGDEKGTPGSLVSFFVQPGAKDGAVGKYQFATLTFSIDIESIDFWVDRLTAHDVPFKSPQQRSYDEIVIYLEDRDGLGIELIGNSRDTRQGFRRPEITQNHAIKGLYSVEIWLPTFFKTGAFLENLGLELLEEKGQIRRYGYANEPGAYIDVQWGKDGSVGIAGTGAIEHVGLQIETYDDLKALHQELTRKGIEMTPIRERTYYKSFFMRDPEGLIFEISTKGPGVTEDEALGVLGEKLALPRWEGFRRNFLESILPKLALP